MIQKPKKGLLLGVEHDYLPNLEVFVSAGCIPQEDYTPLHVGRCGQDWFPPQGFRGGHPPRLGGPGANGPLVGVLRVVPLKLKTNVKLPCKSIVISSQSTSFIRRMILWYNLCLV